MSRRAWISALIAAAILWTIILLCVLFWRVILELIFLAVAIPFLWRVAANLAGTRPRRRRGGFTFWKWLLDTALLAAIYRRVGPPAKQRRIHKTPQPVYPTRRGQGGFPDGY